MSGVDDAFTYRRSGSRMGGVEFVYTLGCGCTKISSDVPPTPVSTSHKTSLTRCWTHQDMVAVLDRKPTDEAVASGSA